MKFLGQILALFATLFFAQAAHAQNGTWDEKIKEAITKCVTQAVEKAIALKDEKELFIEYALRKFDTQYLAKTGMGGMNWKLAKDEERTLWIEGAKDATQTLMPRRMRELDPNSIKFDFRQMVLLPGGIYNLTGTAMTLPTDDRAAERGPVGWTIRLPQEEGQECIFYDAMAAEFWLSGQVHAYVKNKPIAGGRK